MHGKGDKMYSSTKNYAKTVIRKLMSQCDLSISDIETAVKELKYELQNGQRL